MRETREAKIIQLLYSRDERAIAIMHRKYGGLCWNVARRFLDSKQDIEECIQDAIHTVWNQIPPDRPRNLDAYLLIILRRQCLHKLEYMNRQCRNPDREVALEEIAEILPAAHGDPGEENWDLRRILNEFLTDEPEKSRKVFIARYFFYHSVRDISQELGIPENTVYSLLRRSKERLAKKLDEEGIDY